MTDVLADVFATRAAEHLAANLCSQLGSVRRRSELTRFSDGEMVCRILQPPGADVAILLHTCQPPANDSIFELLFLADACRRAGYSMITALVPYLAYTRGDKRNGKLESIAARLIADLIAAAGIRQLFCLEPHFAQLEGFYSIPCVALSAAPLLCNAIRAELTGPTVVISPDAGALRTVRTFSQLLDLPLTLMDKAETKVGGEPSTRSPETERFLIVDDMISTGSSLASVIKRLRALNADAEIWVSATHGLFLASAIDILSAPYIRRVFVTDTIRQNESLPCHFTVVPTVSLLAEAVAQALRLDKTRVL